MIVTAYSVSPETGDVVTYIKLQRVVLLPIVLVLIIWPTKRSANSPVQIPWFVVAFFAFVLVNSFVQVLAFPSDVAGRFSAFFLLTAIAALFVKRSLKEMAEVSGDCATIVVAETVAILSATILITVYLH